jgi:hypothetical protein
MFARVRKTFMDSMREEFGRDIADRTLGRINKRRTEGYFRK